MNDWSSPGSSWARSSSSPAMSATSAISSCCCRRWLPSPASASAARSQSFRRRLPRCRGAARSSPCLSFCSSPTSSWRPWPGCRSSTRSVLRSGSRPPPLPSQRRPSTCPGPALARWLAAPIAPAGAALIVLLVMAGDLVQFGQWAAWRTYKNYDASRALAAVLPEGTLVQGKLANGLALENRIKPMFIGREFGNYADRLERDDVRYLLTYSAPRLGYEGAVVLDVLAAYPDRRSHLVGRRRRNDHRTRPRGTLRQGTASSRISTLIVRKIDEQAIRAYGDRRFRSEYRLRAVRVLPQRQGARVPRSRRRRSRRAAFSTPAAAAAACRSRSRRKRPAPSSASTSSIASVMPGRGWRASAVSTISPSPRPTASRCPSRASRFDAVLSHAVIEHVADAPRYLAECARVLRTGGWMYLSTAPYLSFAGAHLPRLKLPIPLHLLLGRRLAFGIFVFLARHAPWTLREPARSELVHQAGPGEPHQARRPAGARACETSPRSDRGRRLRGGARVPARDLDVPPAPGPIARWIRDSPLTQDIAIGNIEYVLRKRAAPGEVVERPPAG